MFGSGAPPPSTRRKRVALLSAEADVQRAAAAERARGVQSKASFLIVAAGFLVGAALLEPTGNHAYEDLLWWLLLLRAVTALGAVIAAVVALWPMNLDIISPVLLRAEWIDSDKSDYELEIHLLKAKVVAWEKISVRTKGRWRSLKVGFFLVGISFAVTLAATVISAMK